MATLIMIAALLVIATIGVCLATASDLHRRKSELSGFKQVLSELRKNLEETKLQTKVVQGNLELLEKVKSDKSKKIKLLNEELEELKVERVAEHEIKTAEALKQKSFSDEGDSGATSGSG